jgi:hypothetical protein
LKLNTLFTRYFAILARTWCLLRASIIDNNLSFSISSSH